MVTQGQVPNKKGYISTSVKPYSTKLEMIMAYEKMWPPKMVAWHNSHVANKNNYIFVSMWFMTTKLKKMMDYGIGPPLTKSHDFLIAWLYVVSWQNKKCYISNSSGPMDTKLERLVADIVLTLKKPHHT